MVSLLSAPMEETAITDSVAIATSVPTDSITNIADSITNEPIAMNVSLDDYITMLRTTSAQIKAMTPIDLTLGMLSNNLSWSIIVSLPVAMFASLRKTKKS